MFVKREDVAAPLSFFCTFAIFTSMPGLADISSSPPPSSSDVLDAVSRLLRGGKSSSSEESSSWIVGRVRLGMFQ